MSDAGRKDLSTQLGEAVQPDATKSTSERAKESVTGTADHIAGAAQPESNKSAGQALGDNTRSGADNGKGVLAQAGDAVSNAAANVRDTVTGNKQ